MLNLWWFLTSYLRSILKWFLRRTTGLCELQRICYGEPSGAPRITSVERSLNSSKSPLIKRLIEHLNEISDNRRLNGSNEREILQGSVNTILLVKKINPKVHFQFVKNISRCIEQIWGYRQVLVEIEQLRQTGYDSDNAEHEEKLLALWNALMPENLTQRISKQWQEIGFQGDDPKTDFRGMGMLGLENLLFFATEYKMGARHVLSHSNHPKYGYSFAIVGINLTSLALNLTRNGEAKTYFYNHCKALPTIDIFHRFYCYLFYEFDRFWLECKPVDIMEFSNIKNKFEENIRRSLMDLNALFKINISIDTV